MILRCTALVRSVAGLSLLAWGLGCASGDSTGTGGNSGTGGSGTGTGGSGIVMNPSSSYAQNAGSTAAFPYPQGHALPNCAFPTYNTDIVDTA